MSKTPLYLMALLAMLSVLACNPFAGGDEQAVADNTSEVVEVTFDRPSDNPLNQSQPESTPSDQPATEASGESAEQDPAEAIEEPPLPTEGSESANAPAESPAEEFAGAAAIAPPDADEAAELVWAFLSQCVSLRTSDLQSRQVDGQWFVQAAGESPDLYGIWKVDPATGSVEAHNMRAREWSPRINSACTPEAFAEFYAPTPAPPVGTGVSVADDAVTALWATLVKCYPTVQVESLEATHNPTRAEWIVTGTPEVTTNYGVWAVRSNGEVVPHNRQAQGIYDQLGNGLC